jgi:hypothetical protein
MGRRGHGRALDSIDARYPQAGDSCDHHLWGYADTPSRVGRALPAESPNPKIKDIVGAPRSVDYMCEPA